MSRTRYISNSRKGIRGSTIKGNLIRQSIDDSMGVELYEIDTVAKYDVGTRVETGDGRVFRYAKSGAACYTGRGCGFYQDKAIAANSVTALAATDTVIDFASLSFTKDELKGGYITIFGGSPADADCPHRLILGNTLASSSTVYITMDGPVGRVVDAAQYCEAYYNPYDDLRSVTLSNVQSFAGVAAAYVSAASKYFWVQTWGPCWVSPQVASFASGAYRDAYFRHDGTITAYSKDQADEYSLNKQRAGFIIPLGLTAGPLLMLQVSP